MSKDNHEAFETFEFDLPPIRGFPELRWAGKRPFKSTQYFPAQKRESYGDPTDGWWNRIYWGDNLQVMSHLLREFRGKVDLVYLDPPFDSKAEYKKRVSIRGIDIESDQNSFEEKQYNDLWSSDEYLQFMYDRLILARELISDDGSIFLHCDWHKSHHLRNLMDEIFGPDKFVNEIIWLAAGGGTSGNRYSRKHQTIFYYTKAKSDSDRVFNADSVRVAYNTENIKPQTYSFEANAKKRPGFKDGYTWVPNEKGKISPDVWLDCFLAEGEGIPLDVWSDIKGLYGPSGEIVGYPTQKPEALLRRIILGSSRPGDLIFDCFMGSGTTQAVAMKLGRRFIGADINLGAIETAVQRLNKARSELGSTAEDLFDESAEKIEKHFAGIELYNVNNYDLFRNPVEAKELIREAMELQPLPPSSAFDGQRDGYLVKIMPVNRITTRQDLNEVINGLDYKAFERRQAEAPTKPVERIHLVCMGHEPDLGPELVKAAKPFDIEVLVTDLIRDKTHLHFKKASDARLAIAGGELVIEGFYPMNLLQKLSLEPGAVEDWRQLVESVKVDFNFDGAVLTPVVVDAPDKNELVSGRYAIPADAGTIRVKITDLLSESWEGEIQNG